MPRHRCVAHSSVFFAHSAFSASVHRFAHGQMCTAFWVVFHPHRFYVFQLYHIQRRRSGTA